MNIARWFSAYRLLEIALAREQSEVARLNSELQKWQDRWLQAKGAAPIHNPLPQAEPIERPVIGISDKRRRLASVPNNDLPTAEDILAAAEKAKAASG